MTSGEHSQPFHDPLASWYLTALMNHLRKEAQSGSDRSCGAQSQWGEAPEVPHGSQNEAQTYLLHRDLSSSQGLSTVLGEQMLVWGWELRVQGLVVALRQGKGCEDWWGQRCELRGQLKLHEGWRG